MVDLERGRVTGTPREILGSLSGLRFSISGAAETAEAFLREHGAAGLADDGEIAHVLDVQSSLLEEKILRFSEYLAQEIADARAARFKTLGLPLGNDCASYYGIRAKIMNEVQAVFRKTLDSK